MRKWMWVGLVRVAVIAIAVMVFQVSQRAQAAVASPEILVSSIWDDGKAEFSVYDGTGVFEGRERNFEAKIIVLKEDFVRDLQVKSDHGPVPGRTTPVLKMNYFHDVSTGVYAFHQMVSVFFERDTFRPVKLAMSSTEGCGISYLVAKPEGKILEHSSHSYWDDEGDRNLEVAWSDEAVFYDALPLWLRGLELGQPGSYVVPLLPSQISSRIGNPKTVTAQIEVTGATPRGKTGRFAVTVRHDGKEDRLWFDSEAPHVLVRWEKANGTVLKIRKTMRLAYWKYTAPEDAALLR